MRICAPSDDIDDDDGWRDIREEERVGRDAATTPPSPVDVDDGAPSYMYTHAATPNSAATGPASTGDDDGGVETATDAAGGKDATRSLSEDDNTNAADRGDVLTPTKKRCEHCDRTTGKSLRGLFSACSSCRDVYYCTRACQSQDWRRYHADMCRGMQEIDGVVPKLLDVEEMEEESFETSMSIKRAEDHDDDTRLIYDESTTRIWVESRRGGLVSAAGLRVREERDFSSYCIWGVQQGLMLQKVEAKGMIEGEPGRPDGIAQRS